MRTLEILSGTDANDQPGFLYRYTDDTNQHPYIWIDTLQENELRKKFENEMSNRTSVEFPNKNGITYAWRETGGSHVFATFTELPKKIQKEFIDVAKQSIPNAKTPV